ncbi:hypothetical protein CAEBREN_13672 [Caenorhabditis brenneri]|uniref:Secreted protein n=1 Tax=Caenorhabditis brenneri TaxID=135651 RepID=G0NLV5_CAEBE|nr:hypothetical protein CAEBREN_13672 [Caenorhabditis brenneri]
MRWFACWLISNAPRLHSFLLLLFACCGGAHDDDYLDIYVCLGMRMQQQDPFSAILRQNLIGTFVYSTPDLKTSHIRFCED